MEGTVGSRPLHKSLNFSLVVCVSPLNGKFLAVSETEEKGFGWAMPGGAVDSGQSFQEAALRECQEEAGLRIRLLGIVKIERHIV